MTVVLVTGMSGVGKSAVLVELARRGYAVVDTDHGGYAVERDGEQRWVEDRITALLDEHTDGTLFLAGTVANQGRFYPRFAAVALLSAPTEVMLARIATRTDNPFGRSTADRQRILADRAAVEPLLRAGADLEVDTATEAVSEVADALEALARL